MAEVIAAMSPTCIRHVTGNKHCVELSWVESGHLWVPFAERLVANCSKLNSAGAFSSWHPREDVRNNSCVSGLRNLENDTTHGRTGSTVHGSRPPAPTNQVSAWQAGRESRPTCMSACRRGCYKDPHEETAFVEFKLYPVILLLNWQRLTVSQTGNRFTC